MVKEKTFVVHFCKNKECNNAWLDEDLTNAKSRVPQWKYCPECCNKYGFINPIFPPKKQLSERQKETIQKNKFCKRKKSSVLKEIDKGGILHQKTN